MHFAASVSVSEQVNNFTKIFCRPTTLSLNNTPSLVTFGVLENQMCLNYRYGAWKNWIAFNLVVEATH